MDSGQQILVGHRDDRDVHPGHPADFRGEHSGCVDNHLGFDRSAAGLDTLDGAAFDADRSHPNALANSCPPSAGPLREGESQAAGVEVAIGVHEGGAHDPLRTHEWETLNGLSGRDQFDGQAEACPPARLPLQLFHPCCRGG